MSTNASYYSATTPSERMLAHDLAVGQVLTMVVEDGGRWGGPITFREQQVTVERVLKTRLVVETAGGGLLRFIVEHSSTYTFRNDEVTTRLEGESTSWSRPARLLYTEGDPQLVERRERAAAHNAQLEAKTAALRTLDAFKASLSVDRAEEAIVALQAYVASQAR